MRETVESTLPPELQRYTLTPAWMDRQLEEERRARAVRELQERMARR
jgi:hypothetical protein